MEYVPHSPNRCITNIVSTPVVLLLAEESVAGASPCLPQLAGCDQYLQYCVSFAAVGARQSYVSQHFAQITHVILYDSNSGVYKELHTYLKYLYLFAVNSCRASAMAIAEASQHSVALGFRLA